MSDVICRRAKAEDLQAIIHLLADDELGRTRETTQSDQVEVYDQAFSEIASDPNQFLCVAERSREIIGTLQLSFIPGLSRSGTKRGQIEGVRVAEQCRGEGVGEAMIAWAIAKCRSQGCSLIQLTTDRQRDKAHRFYEKLGFTPSHVGYKLSL